MRKLHLITAMYVSKGHGFEYVSNFCSKLKNDFDITLYIASKEKVETPNGIKIIYINANYKKTEANNFVKYSKIAPYIRAVSKQFYSIKYYRGIIKSNVIQNEDLVYIMDYDVLPLIYLVRKFKKLNTKSYLWIHSARFKSKDVFYSLYKALFKKVFNSYINNAISSVIVNGEFIKARIIENLEISPNKIEVIQYPSEINFSKINKEEARKEIGFDKTDKIVLFFGMLRKDKNIEQLIKSVADCSNSPLLLIAGSEASVKKEDILIWIDKYGLKNYMLDIDYISEEKMAIYYSCSDLLLLTYNLESGSQSGPLSLSREFELPAIVNNVGEIGQYVLSNNLGLVANPSEPRGFTNCIDAFFNNQEAISKELEGNLKIAKDKYSWNSASKKYLSLFKEGEDV